LKHTQDAEDAFQATFLVFARKAGSIRKRASVSSWLHGVAYRIARKVRTVAARRTVQESRERDRPRQEGLDEITWRELREVLDTELEQLPERHRAPLVLCYLEGKTQDEAAQELGWCKSTFRRRLEQGRQLLRDRLARRGVTLSAALFAPLLAEQAAATGLPGTLVGATVKVGVRFASGQAVLEEVSAMAKTLTEGLLQTMLLTKLKIALAFCVTVSAITIGGGLFSYHVLMAEPGAPQNGTTALQQNVQRKARSQPMFLATDVPKVLEKFRSTRPEAKDLAIFRLDWVATLQAAKAKAAQELRPILLMVVTNSYGNMYSGHC
jgi:RNA polymerase sigma factor (sigma-70 family)